MKLPPKDHHGHLSIEGLYRKKIIPSLMFVLLPVMLWVTQTEPTYVICHFVTTGYYVPIPINSKEQALAHRNHPKDFIAPVEGCSELLITPVPSDTSTSKPSNTPTNTPSKTFVPQPGGDGTSYPPPVTAQLIPSDTPTQEPPTPIPSPSHTPVPILTPRPTGEFLPGIGTTAKALIIVLALLAFAIIIYFVKEIIWKVQ